MLFPLVSEGWTPGEGYWRNTSYSSTDYQRLISPHTLHCNNLKFLQWQILLLVLKGFQVFVTDVNLYPFSLQTHQGLWLNQVKGWTWNTTSNTSNHHARQKDELVQNYVARLDLHKKALKEQLWCGTHPVWSNTAAPPKAGYQLCPCWFPGNKHSYKKHTHPLAQRWSSGLGPGSLGFLCRLGNSSISISPSDWKQDRECK